MRSRIEVRKARLTPVVASHDNWPQPTVLVATEVSPRGLFVSGDLPADLGDSLRLSYRLGTPERFEFEAEVVHTAAKRRQTDLGYTGLGLTLLDAAPLERLRMRHLLRKLPPPLPKECLKEMIKGVAPTRRREGRRGGRRRSDPVIPQRWWVISRPY